MEKSAAKHTRWLRFSGELLVALGVVITFTILILLLSGAPPLAAFAQIIKGSLGSWSKFAHVVKAWIPLTLCGMGLLYTFRIGLWNIGIEGQVIAGAIATTAILKLGLDAGSPSIFVALAIGAGAAGGAFWAILAGWLKTKGGVHEIFAGLGLIETERGYPATILLVLGVFVGSGLWWLLLSSSVGMFRGRLNTPRLRWVNRGSGVILAGFSLVILFGLLGEFV